MKMIRRLLPVVLLLASCSAHGQTSPGFAGIAQGNSSPLTAQALNNAFAAKQDVGGDISNSYAHATGSTGTHTIADWMAYLNGTPLPNLQATNAGLGSGQWAWAPLPTTTLPAANGAGETISFDTSASGGTTGDVYSLARRTLTISGAPDGFWWADVNILDYSGTGGTGQHVAGYDQANRYAYATGGASDNPQLWAAVSEFNDFTNQPSANTNAEMAHEFDISGGGRDNGGSDGGGNRQVISLNVTPRGTKGFFETSGVINAFVHSGAYARTFETFNGALTGAGIDFRYVQSYAKGVSSLNNPAPAVVVAQFSPTTIEVSNVMPFIGDIYHRDLDAVSGGSFNKIYFSDGQSAVVISYTMTPTGNPPTGTLTLASPITVAPGTVVYDNSAAIWLATGQRIALDTNGDTGIASDGSAITATDSTGFLSTGGMKLPIKTVATLPTCNAASSGLMLAVSDATSPSYNGALTGGGSVEIPVFCNGSAWTAH